MYIVLLTLMFMDLILLLVVASIQPEHCRISLFELNRRAKLGDKRAAYDLRREGSLNDIILLTQVLSSLLLVIFVALSVVTLDWLTGIVVAFIITIFYRSMADLGPIKSLAKTLYYKIERPLLNYVQKETFIVKLFRTMPTSEAEFDRRVDSREELQQLVANSDGVLTPDEKRLLVHSLSFGDKLVGDVMTPRSMIVDIKKTDLLGPLRLSDLHKTGHSRFPVIDEDIDHVVGILHISNLLTLDNKKSTTAENAMEPKVYYIREDQALCHALAAFIRTKHHLFVVVNEFRETVGLLSLEDVIEVLIGRKIVDEFDKHDDLRAVAMRNPKSNNRPQKRIDV